MTRTAHTLSVGALIVLAVCAPAASAEAQIPAHVRVVTGSARILRWLRPANEVVLTVDKGTTLEVLDQEADWYWVVLPQDAHGTRKVGWIRAINVEPFNPPPAPLPTKSPGGEAQAPAPAPAARAVPTAPAAAEDKVTITARRDATSPGTADAGAAKAYTFEDVHFDRDRSSLLRDDMDTLRAAVTALKADPSLVVNIEGHTCNLGTTAYNLALGDRRASAVKAYLVSEGVSPDRLYTISRGEQQPKFDNAHEDTRRLNRRVAIVPKR